MVFIGKDCDSGLTVKLYRDDQTWLWRGSGRWCLYICFWHAHVCGAFHLPTSNASFRKEKLHKNVERDLRQVAELHALRCRVLAIWECATKCASKTAKENYGNDLYQIACDWIVNYDSNYLELSKGKGNVISKRRTTARAL